MWRAVAAIAFSLIPCLSMANPTTIVDDTEDAATADGTINGGEYPGYSEGINDGFGDVVGTTSKLYLDSNIDGDITLALEKGPGTFGTNIVVVYLDTGVTGFADTTSFTDYNDSHRAAISGMNNTDRSELFFADQFQASHAIAFNETYAGAWGLVAAASHNHLLDGTIGAVAANHYEIEFTDLLSSIGLEPGDSFRYIATYLTPSNGYRSNEFHGVDINNAPAKNPGYNPGTVNLGVGDYNTFTTVAVDYGDLP